MTVLTLESEYLIKLIKSVLNEKTLPTAPESIDWHKFFQLAKSQQVYSIIAGMLGQCKMPDDIKQELAVYSQNELLRILSMKNEFEELEEELEKSEIKYMLLKGSVLRKYYPQQKMRQMSDIDLFYDYEKRDKLIKIMKNHGYRLTTTCENSDDFFKEPFYTFEWHREVFFEEAKFCPHFDLWKNSVQDKDKPFMYHINSTDHFVYTVCHMYKHYITNGCGIRFLCDIYLFLKNDKSVDLKLAEEQFENIGIGEFAKNAILLSKGIFDDGETNLEQKQMLEYMLSNGVYGVHKVDYNELLQEHGNSKIRYILSRIFPPKKKMFAEYKILEEKPYLLLWFYIVRLFTKFKYNSSKAKTELKEIKKTKK